MMDGRAIIYTHANFTDLAAKTAHGLLRSSERYQIEAVIDSAHAGQDAGELLDGQTRHVPIYASVADYLQAVRRPADFCIIGIANAGGKLHPDWMAELEVALTAGISLVNGMHQYLSDLPLFVDLARKHEALLIDVRQPKPASAMHFWSGAIYDVPCPIVPVLGTDCAVGKRTTARFLEAALKRVGIRAEMIYTGQTGWLQGGRYGFVLDSVPNDFVCGELEHAIVTCYENLKPDIILVEGQAALRNPSGPCGTEFLVSGRADAAVLVHPVGRTYFKGWDQLGFTVPQPADEINLIRRFGVETIGLTLNTRSVTLEQAQAAQQRYQQELGIPVALPVEEGVQPLIGPLKQLIRNFRK